MKALTLILLMICAFTSFAQINRSTVVFKVQIGQGTNKTKADFADIDSLTYYTLPSGAKLFFSGGDFKVYEDAVAEMKRLEKLGYDVSVMTAFKQGAPISLESDEVKTVIKKQKEFIAQQSSTVTDTSDVVSQGKPSDMTWEQFLAMSEDHLEEMDIKSENKPTAQPEKQKKSEVKTITPQEYRAYKKVKELGKEREKPQGMTWEEFLALTEKDYEAKQVLAQNEKAKEVEEKETQVALNSEVPQNKKEINEDIVQQRQVENDQPVMNEGREVVVQEDNPKSVTEEEVAEVVQNSDPKQLQKSAEIAVNEEEVKKRDYQKFSKKEQEKKVYEKVQVALDTVQEPTYVKQDFTYKKEEKKYEKVDVEIEKEEAELVALEVTRVKEAEMEGEKIKRGIFSKSKTKKKEQSKLVSNEKEGLSSDNNPSTEEKIAVSNTKPESKKDKKVIKEEELVDPRNNNQKPESIEEEELVMSKVDKKEDESIKKEIVFQADKKNVSMEKVGVDNDKGQALELAVSEKTESEDPIVKNANEVPKVLKEETPSKAIVKESKEVVSEVTDKKETVEQIALKDQQEKPLEQNEGLASITKEDDAKGKMVAVVEEEETKPEMSKEELKKAEKAKKRKEKEAFENQEDIMSEDDMFAAMMQEASNDKPVIAEESVAVEESVTVELPWEEEESSLDALAEKPEDKGLLGKVFGEEQDVELLDQPDIMTEDQMMSGMMVVVEEPEEEITSIDFPSSQEEEEVSYISPSSSPEPFPNYRELTPVEIEKLSPEQLYDYKVQQVLEELKELAEATDPFTEEEDEMIKKEDELRFMVTERPVFRVCVGKFKENEKVVRHKGLMKLHHVVYNFKSQSVHYHVYGRFENLVEAAEGLYDARDAGIQDAFVIGYYMNTVVSVKLANQLIELYDDYQELLLEQN